MNGTIAQRVTQEPFKCQIVAQPGAFSVEIYGTIGGVVQHAETTVALEVEDVTEGPDRHLPVWAAGPQDGQQAPGAAFHHQTPLGPVEAGGLTLSQWTSVARLKLEGLRLPRRGQRTLAFHLSVDSVSDRRRLARAHCLWEVQNPHEGYLDLQEKEAQVRLWAMPLAFAVAGARPSMPQFRLIFRWILPTLDWNAVSLITRGRFLWALWSMSRTAGAMRPLQLRKLCVSIAAISSTAGRYPILALCLSLCAAKRRVRGEEIERLWRLAEWLQLDVDRVRQMMDRTLPIHRHEMVDPPALLGLSPNLSAEEALKLLNREYAKWNARVTHADRSVQAQAAEMIELIARTRSHFVA